ncbi:thiamine pyrophosphate-binding protein [Streptomyces sp. NPDC001970]
MSTQATVHSVTYDLLRSLGPATVFGNPGSTEQTFLQNFPDDFTYVLALQEASVIAMADGFAQTTRRPALVNVHSSAGLGNSIGNLVAAHHGHTPLIVTAGRQHRELLIGEPYLGNRDATNMPRPWVKWSYEPARAEDVRDRFMRAYAMALQPPAGPVSLSIPLDDWNHPLDGPAVEREVSRTYAPDSERLRRFAERITESERPALILGPDVDRAGGWQAGVAGGARAGPSGDGHRRRGPGVRLPDRRCHDRRGTREGVHGRGGVGQAHGRGGDHSAEDHALRRSEAPEVTVPIQDSGQW